MLKRIRDLFAGRRAETPSDPASRKDQEDSRIHVHRGPDVVHRPIPRSDLDADAVKIVLRLTRFDHAAYLVGGCVRDLLLERKPKDFDLGTSATPRQVKRMFRNCRIIGRRFRLAHIYFQNGKIIEVATFRALEDEEGTNSGDGDDLMIRDDNIFGTAEEDALRRDFTINALFYDINNETVLDHAEGLRDLRLRLVRTIGDPATRFREDSIRILRAIKFAARLDFKIEEKTLAGLRETTGEIARAAPPRVLEELNRFCRGGAARRSFELMRETDVLQVVLPEIAGDYAKRPDAWRLLLDLLGQMDRRRFPEAREIRTGEIMAVLLLPLLLNEMGWSPDGTVAEERPRNTRDRVDDLQKPVALRLRMSRREQEHCRQILTSLARMVPASRIRAGTRRALLSRECLPDTLWILEWFAEQWEGEFAEALALWSGEMDVSKRSGGARREEPGSARPRGRRRRGGRGRTRGSGEREPAAAASAAPADGGDSPRRRSKAEEPAKDKAKGEGARAATGAGSAERPQREGMPSVWDERYFFAALPSVPEGAEVEAQPTDPSADETEIVEATAEAGPANPDEDTPRPRRRRRRRRRRRPAEDGGDGTTPTAEAEAAEADAASPETEPGS